MKSIPELRKVLEKIKKAWRDDIDPALLGNPVSEAIFSCLDLSKAYRVIDWDQAVTFAHSLFLDLLLAYFICPKT